MGMDVYGINPFNELGEYFRANCWTWRPICVAIEESGAGITSMTRPLNSSGRTQVVVLGIE